MKIFFGPKVYLASSPCVEYGGAGDPGFRDFLRDEGVPGYQDTSRDDGDILPEWAGRLCYMSYKNPRPGGNTAYLQHVKEVGHGSVLEHSNFGMIFTQVSRTLTHELVRHRAGAAYSQLSQRYVDESDVGFVVPPELRAEVEAYLGWKAAPTVDMTPAEIAGCRWHQACVGALYSYQELVAYLTRTLDGDGTELRKRCRQAARSVLPNCTETKIFVTMNARAWRHFIEMRCSRHADAEIRRLAGMIWGTLKPVAPNLFGDYEPVALPDGSFELATPCRKV